jgi:hypothetical protein
MRLRSCPTYSPEGGAAHFRGPRAFDTTSCLLPSRCGSVRLAVAGCTPSAEREYPTCVSFGDLSIDPFGP